ncbi:hypothetical protein BDZ97DRAFT_1836604 [Flammula alnicola]|nr:hypothetical protein BDZ97DRAFT_1836604 [Flammula alnicola]
MTLKSNCKSSPTISSNGWFCAKGVLKRRTPGRLSARKSSCFSSSLGEHSRQPIHLYLHSRSTFYLVFLPPHLTR